jgi:hypothetical protein
MSFQKGFDLIMKMDNMFNIDEEYYLPIVENVNYSVSNKGNVKNTVTGKVLKPRINRGYEIVNLYSDDQVKTLKVHRLVATTFLPNPKHKKCVDHIDHNRTNNTIDNLRFATNQENNQNASKRKTNTSGYIGVRFHKKKWCAEIRINGKKKHIGCFATAEEASKAYQERAKIEFGDFHNNLF